MNTKKNNDTEYIALHHTLLVGTKQSGTRNCFLSESQTLYYF